MDKYRKKGFDRTRAMAIKWTAEKFGFTREYVRSIVNGHVSTENADKALKAFKAKYEELEQILS